MTLQDDLMISLQGQFADMKAERDNYHTELLKMINLQEKTLVDRDEAYKEARQYQERMQRVIDGSAAKDTTIAKLLEALEKIAESCNLTTTSCCQRPHEIAIDVLADTAPSKGK
jgi:uncharacterized coiled-coil DUF342 family protein